MGQPISSAEPERLFRYSDFGVQLDHDLTVEAARLAATLQHFEATCTEPGFQVGVGHLAGNLRGYAGQNESVDSWVRQVGQGFQMADQIGLGWVRIPELPGQWMRILPLPIRLPSTWQMPIRIRPTLPRVPEVSYSDVAAHQLRQRPIHIRPTLPRIRIPGWLIGILPILPWLIQKPGRVPLAPWDRREPERVPSEPAPAVPEPTPPDSDRAAPEPVKSGYDGKDFAPETNQRPWQPVEGPARSNPSTRDRRLYEAVISQFGVEKNPRYKQNQKGSGDTYCNIFAWDVTKAMGAEIPHWMDDHGNPVPVGKGREMDANGMVKWLQEHGQRNGWRKASAQQAQIMANNGCPAVAVRENFGGIGHVAMVRPGLYTEEQGPRIAQAGARNFNDTSTKEGFVTLDSIEYYVHD